MGTFLSTGKCEPGCLGLGKRSITTSNSGGRGMASSSSEPFQEMSKGGELHGGQKSIVKRSVTLARAQVDEVINEGGLPDGFLSKLRESVRLLTAVEAQLSENSPGELEQRVRRARGRSISSAGFEELVNGPKEPASNGAKTVRKALMFDLKEEEDREGSDHDSSNMVAHRRPGRTYSREVRNWVVKHYTHGASANAEDVSLLQTAMSSRLSDGASDKASRRASMGMEEPPMLSKCGSNPELTDMLEKVGQLDFDTPFVCNEPEVSRSPITVLLSYACNQSDMLVSLPDSICSGDGNLIRFKDKLHSYTRLIDEAYLDVIYHNRLHAADVMMMMHWFLTSVYMELFVNPFDHLMCLIASAVHDVGHDGVNNLFHVKTRSNLALRYSDRSVLENFHASLAFETMRDNQEANWFDMLNAKFQPDTTQKAVDLQFYMRKGITEMILMTDTTKHDYLLKLLNDTFTADLPRDSGSAGDARSASRKRSEIQLIELQQKENYENKHALMQVLLHAADISNPARPRETALYFTRRVLLEFWAQGDEERRLGLEVSPLCDRAAGMASVPAGQIGFTTYVVQPLFKDLSLLIREVGDAVRGLETNVKWWQKKKEAAASFDDIFDSINSDEEEENQERT